MKTPALPGCVCFAVFSLFSRSLFFCSPYRSVRSAPWNLSCAWELSCCHQTSQRHRSSRRQNAPPGRCSSRGCSPHSRGHQRPIARRRLLGRSTIHSPRICHRHAGIRQRHRLPYQVAARPHRPRYARPFHHRSGRQRSPGRRTWLACGCRMAKNFALQTNACRRALLRPRRQDRASRPPRPILPPLEHRFFRLSGIDRSHLQKHPFLPHHARRTFHGLLLDNTCPPASISAVSSATFTPSLPKAAPSITTLLRPRPRTSHSHLCLAHRHSSSPSTLVSQLGGPTIATKPIVPAFPQNTCPRHTDEFPPQTSSYLDIDFQKKE